MRLCKMNIIAPVLTIVFSMTAAVPAAEQTAVQEPFASAQQVELFRDSRFYSETILRSGSSVRSTGTRTVRSESHSGLGPDVSYRQRPGPRRAATTSSARHISFVASVVKNG